MSSQAFPCRDTPKWTDGSGGSGPSFAYSLPVHSSHTRKDRVASLTTCRLHGAAIQKASPPGPGRALTLPCGCNIAGRRCAAFARGQRAHGECSRNATLAAACAESCGRCSCDDDAGADCSLFAESARAGDFTPLGVPSKCTQSPFIKQMRKCPSFCGNCGHCTATVRDLQREHAGVFLKAAACAVAEPRDEATWRSAKGNASCANYTKGSAWHRYCKDDGADLHCPRACDTCKPFNDRYFAHSLQQLRIVELVDLLQNRLGVDMRDARGRPNETAPSLLSLLDHACDPLKPKSHVDEDKVAMWLQAFLLEEVAAQSQKLAKLVVTFAEFPVERIVEQEAYGYTSAFADLGGTFGLAAGLSLITVLEVVEYFILELWHLVLGPLAGVFCCVRCRKKKKHEQRVKEKNDAADDVFHKMDLNGDGFITPEELRAAGEPVVIRLC